MQVADVGRGDPENIVAWTEMTTNCLYPRSFSPVSVSHLPQIFILI